MITKTNFYKILMEIRTLTLNVVSVKSLPLDQKPIDICGPKPRQTKRELIELKYIKSVKLFINSKHNNILII